ncbi:MAG: nitrogen fixation protein NifU [Acidimicrobiia bacterium]|jgi:nitrogen fixation NifU-like protein|nr:nitrogen fixation protein NifU [Acidimicrobiia bacterium]
MAGLEDLYREIILDHYKNPRLKGELPPPAHRTQGFNPLCGDEVVVTVDVENGKIEDLRFTGQGCSISQSSASMMAAAVKGRSVDEVNALTRAFKRLLSIRDQDDDDDGQPQLELGELEALKGVMKFPSRIKCATLAWNTLAQALDESAAAPTPGS